MPIILDDVQQNTGAVQTFNPKLFFHDKLTGRGGTTAGLLSAKNNPNTIDQNVVTSSSHYSSSKRDYHNGTTQTSIIPMLPIAQDCLNYMTEITRPDISELLCIGQSRTTATNNSKLYMDMQIACITINDSKITTQNGFGPTTTKRELIQCYYTRVFVVKDANDKKAVLTDMLSFNAYENLYAYVMTSNPLVELPNIITQALSRRFDIDTKAILDYVANIDIYDMVVRACEVWQTTIDKVMDELLSNMSSQKQAFANSTREIMLKYQLKYLMTYNIPLDLYRNIHKSVAKYFTPQEANDLCKQNLNLLLSDTMNNLQNNKSLIQSFTPPQPTVQLPQSVVKLSAEQTNAVMSTEPLILVQAGAGTGKSTLILGRIDYLMTCGVNPNDIMVLSFTNAAADNIKEKNPNVHSMTIASMIHEIYSANFSGHELSSLDTIINSLDIYYPTTVGTQSPQQKVAETFKRRCSRIIRNDANAFTDMNNFIEENYDDVIAILDTIHQTSLELEIIICYQKIDTLIEPPSVTSKFLIMDEVQDNSIFEFVYTLKYIDKHKESLFIVGDCSQTLYEFRASNPRALNILEGSGTFTTYQLHVNYRSNQEILDFANIILRNIEANQYANIQLQANSLAQVTEQSFLDKVHFNYHQLNKITQWKDALPSIFANEIKPYIDDCIARGEQVAVLAFTRRDVYQIQNILTNQYPNLITTSLVPDKMFNSTIMSNFIKNYWGDIKFVPKASIMNTICSEIMYRLDKLVYDPVAAQPKVTKILSNWKNEQGAIISAWLAQVNNGQLTSDAFMELLKENMLQHEIKSNAMKQALLSNKNQQAKKEAAIKGSNFLLSTIHSAKGLEFDNVVVLYRNENALAEDKKRMYYVAFTRAMKSEYILAYDTVASPQVQADYITVLEGLHKTAPAANSPLNTRPKNRRIKI